MTETSTKFPQHTCPKCGKSAICYQAMSDMPDYPEHYCSNCFQPFHQVLPDKEQMTL